MFQVRLNSPYFVNAPTSAVAGASAVGTADTSTALDPSTSVAAPSSKVTLSAEAQSKVSQLSQTDQKVRAHEQVHMAAGGELIRGGPSYSYQKGPDGKMYAIGGDVSIDVSPGKTPIETISLAQRIRSAALAPVDPSSQDRQVAAEASDMESNANRELAASAQGNSGVDSSSAQTGDKASAQAAGQRMQSFYASVANVSGVSGGLRIEA